MRYWLFAALASGLLVSGCDGVAGPGDAEAVFALHRIGGAGPPAPAGPGNGVPLVLRDTVGMPPHPGGLSRPASGIRSAPSTTGGPGRGGEAFPSSNRIAAPHAAGGRPPAARTPSSNAANSRPARSRSNPHGATSTRSGASDSIS